MGPTDEAQVQIIEEVLDHITAKRVGHSAIVLTPAENILCMERDWNLDQTKYSEFNITKPEALAEKYIWWIGGYTSTK